MNGFGRVFLKAPKGYTALSIPLNGFVPVEVLAEGDIYVDFQFH